MGRVIVHTEHGEIRGVYSQEPSVDVLVVDDRDEETREVTEIARRPCPPELCGQAVVGRPPRK